MKMKIEREGNIFTVTKSRGWLGKLLDIDDAVERYALLPDNTYSADKSKLIGVYIDETGDILGKNNSMTVKLDNFRRAEEAFKNE